MDLFYPKIVCIHGVPRSGTSWLGQIFNSSPNVAFRYQPLFSHAFKSFVDQSSSRQRIDIFFQEILATKDPFILLKDPEFHKGYPEFEKNNEPTHLVTKEVHCHYVLENLIREKAGIKIIGIVRHPCAVISSWIHAPREFDATWDICEEWRSAPKKNVGTRQNYFGYEKWKEVAIDFLALRGKYPDNFFLLRYSELNKSPLETAHRVFQFCGLPLAKQTVRFIECSKSRSDHHPYSVFRTGDPDDKWSHMLDMSISSEILNDLEGTELEPFLG